ncbi:MAG: hypothetical protein LBP26_07560 [Clostridiales bacterium]|nr:hypothetical protein [Clostridiales bacterium]
MSTLLRVNLYSGAAAARRAGNFIRNGSSDTLGAFLEFPSMEGRRVATGWSSAFVGGS